MPDPKKSDSDDKAAAPSETKAAPKAQTRYIVRSNGLTGAGGASYSRGDILTADQIGDAARVEKLLERGAIEVAA